MSEYCPFITCRLTDWYGNEINPYAPGSIVYTVLSSPKEKKSGHGSLSKGLPVAVEGYIAVYSEDKRISPPIPFCILESIQLNVAKGGMVSFQVRDFHCCAIPHWCKKFPATERIQLLISIETCGVSKKDVSLRVPQAESCHKETGSVCIYTTMVYDKVRFRSGCCLNYKNATYQAEIYQYNTIADGVKRTYLNSDELKEYGDRGILSPEEVSYYNVFVNGVMQPPTNYVLKKGELTFTTQEVPAEGRPIMILYTTWKDLSGQIMDVTVLQYNAVSDGTKKIYTDADEIKEYGTHGIPSPCEVSYFNLYSNGVLQPTVVYQVRKGVLELTTSDAPVKGAPIVLESIIIRDRMNQIFRTEACAYNAYSNGGKIYTNQDEILMYGRQGIPAPWKNAFQNLFINSVIQPHVNYQIQEGYLILQTVDNPTVDAPITLQSVKNVLKGDCCVQLSDAALEQWKKEYSYIKDPCASP